MALPSNAPTCHHTIHIHTYPAIIIASTVYVTMHMQSVNNSITTYAVPVPLTTNPLRIHQSNKVPTTITLTLFIDIASNEYLPLVLISYKLPCRNRTIVGIWCGGGGFGQPIRIHFHVEFWKRANALLSSNSKKYHRLFDQNFFDQV